MNTEEAIMQERPAPCIASAVMYLDLDGDGVPDAVRLVDTMVLHTTDNGVADVIRVVEKTDSGIGDDGIATTVDVRETFKLDLGREGVPRRTGAVPHARAQPIS